MIYADNACNAVGMYGNPQVPGPGPAADLATLLGALALQPC